MPPRGCRAASVTSSPTLPARCSPCWCTRPTSKTIMALCRCSDRLDDGSPSCAISSPIASSRAVSPGPENMGITFESDSQDDGRIEVGSDRDRHRLRGRIQQPRTGAGTSADLRALASGGNGIPRRDGGAGPGRTRRAVWHDAAADHRFLPRRARQRKARGVRPRRLLALARAGNVQPFGARARHARHLGRGRRFGKRMFVYGHSAGGHLAACALATDWKAYGMPDNAVPAACAISGLFDLTPLVGISMNQDLRLDLLEARRVSPLFWDAPRGRVLDVIVGAQESREFLRQSREIADAWAKAGTTTRCEEAPGNHFTVLDPLADPGSATAKRLAGLAEQTLA